MMNCKRFGRKRLWHVLRYYHSIQPEVLRKTTNLNQNSRSPGPRIEPGTSQIRSRSVDHSTTTFDNYCMDSYVQTKINMQLQCIPRRKQPTFPDSYENVVSLVSTDVTVRMPAEHTGRLLSHSAVEIVHESLSAASLSH
jgi:hypothetical protein